VMAFENADRSRESRGDLANAQLYGGCAHDSILRWRPAQSSD
jgi:hypothetical protein